MNLTTTVSIALLPAALLSVASPFILLPSVALQRVRPTPLAAAGDRSAPAATAAASSSTSPEKSYLRGHMVDQRTRDVQARSRAARAAATSRGRVPDTVPTIDSVIDDGSDSVAQIESAVAQLGTYGPAIGGDALGNITVGGPVGPKKCFIRFRAEQTSPLVGVTLPFLSADYPGYGGGTGGTLTIHLYADDGSPGHFPTGAPLATRKIGASGSSSAARTLTFSPAFTTTAGAIYHLVLENVDHTPTVNFFSINTWVRLSSTNDGPLNPRTADADWGAGYFHSGAWQNSTGCCPIADIAYGNGAHQGMSYAEASYACPAGAGPCNTDQLVGRIQGSTLMVRERLTVTGGTRTVGGVGVRLLRESATTGDLIVSLRDGLDQEIETVTIPASSVAVGPAPTYSLAASWDDLGQNARWIYAEFTQLHELIDGETYFLRMSSTQGAYWAWVNRRLSPAYAYTATTAFTDGWAEYTTNGSSWQGLGRVPLESDLQFYFLTVAGGGSYDDSAE